MLQIFEHERVVTFQFGEHSQKFLGIVRDVNIDKRTIGENVATNVFYDLDVYYDKEKSLHTLIKHVHSAFVSEGVYEDYMK